MSKRGASEKNSPKSTKRARPTKADCGSIKMTLMILAMWRVNRDRTKVIDEKAIGFEALKNEDVLTMIGRTSSHIKSQLHNQSNLVVRENGEIESEEENKEEPDATTNEEEELEYAVDGKILVIKRSLSLQSLENEQQQENIFHTRCHIQGKMRSVIVDGGSCTNVASSLMVEKLGFPTTTHPHPYKLQWLNDGGEFKVTKQVLVAFSIGKYNDNVLCDVVPMHAGHLLLGRPWQFDR
ncbi:hypothetical protein J1N35_037362 [Gossypium stocksii]|uniref:Asp_protease_2 domain-containing protein n=1 Tax=Gossypium stocksii TaxID=47602 RepID=A0A9D3ZLK2_9ROSI|nr:hypothetical protein J1N35_037362 [Gossypium stocksii]